MILFSLNSVLATVEPKMEAYEDRGGNMQYAGKTKNIVGNVCNASK